MLGHPGHPTISNLTQQMQQAGQQQQQQQGQQQQQQQGQQQQNPNQGPPPNGQDYNLSNVLHFLQTEWRRYERDRNEWEIERAEMRARIALLEGERRSFENVKLDLMRRIKMLEYALRVERSKQLNQPAPGFSSQKAASLQGAVGGDGSHKEGSGNSSPRSEDSPLPGNAENRLSIGSLGGLPNGTGPGITASASGPLSAHPSGANLGARPQTWAGVPNGVVVPVAAGKPPPGRDAKARARSRDFLKQCLQEVNYLTSSQALNPLPNRPLLASALQAQANSIQHAQTAVGQQQMQQAASMNGPGLPLSLPNLPQFGEQQQGAGFGPGMNGTIQANMATFNGRPRKIVPEVGKDFPLLGKSMIPPPPVPVPPMGQHHVLGQSGFNGSPPGPPPSNRPEHLGLDMPGKRSSPMPREAMESGLALERQPSKLRDSGDDSDTESDVSQLTAIFRPDSAGEWKERLRAAAEAERLKGDDDLQSLNAVSLRDEEEEVEGDSEALGDAKLWKPRRTLRNHLDAVRAMAFHPSEVCLATGGDDFTIKIWRVEAADLASSASPSTEIEPQITLRGHSSDITRLVIAGTKNLLYSASLDSTIRVWAIPSADQPVYGPFDASRLHATLVGHTDAVWDLALLRDDTILVSGGADGAVKVWDISSPSANLKLSWGYDGVGGASETNHAVTCVEAIKSELKKVAVAYTNAIIKLFDVDSGAEISMIQGDATYDGTPNTQINKIVSHPTMAILVSAHEDKYIRIWDIGTGGCTHSMLGHVDGVTSLSIDPSGFALVSGGHDASVRFWDLLNTRSCVQEMGHNHRKKDDEGVLDVEFHQSLPFLASCGADGVVKLYASS